MCWLPFLGARTPDRIYGLVQGKVSEAGGVTGNGEKACAEYDAHIGFAGEITGFRESLKRNFFQKGKSMARFAENLTIPEIEKRIQGLQARLAKSEIIEELGNLHIELHIKQAIEKAKRTE